MSYLVTSDYTLGGFISLENLEQIVKNARGITSDYDVLNSCERRAISMCEDYMSAKYRTDIIFATNIDFDLATAFKWNDRIYLTADTFNVATTYSNNDYVLYNGSVYRKNSEVSGYVAGTLPTNATYFDLAGLEGFYYITPPSAYDNGVVYTASQYVTYDFEIYKRNSNNNSEYDLIPTDTNYWTKVLRANYLSEYDVTGEYPKNTTYWTYGDNRNMSLVTKVVDISLFYLHAVINPRNIPALRGERYQECMEYLESLMKGGLNPLLPTIGAQKGYKIRFGSNESFNTIY